MGDGRDSLGQRLRVEINQLRFRVAPWWGPVPGRGARAERLRANGHRTGWEGMAREAIQRAIFLAAVGLFALLCWDHCSSLGLASYERERTLAQCLIAEAGSHLRADHPAILHVLRRRATLAAFGPRATDHRVARAYCAIFKARTPTTRQAAIRSWDWSRLERTSPGVTQLVREWTAGGVVADTCAEPAWDWGARTDVTAVRPGWVLDSRRQLRRVVSCEGSANVFLGRRQRNASVRSLPRVLSAGLASGSNQE